MRYKSSAAVLAWFGFGMEEGREGGTERGGTIAVER